MGKTIELKRDELIWQTREKTWEEKDYLSFLERISKFKNSPWLWQKNLYAAYLVLSKYNWEDICRIWSEEEEEPSVKINTFSGNQIGIPAFDYIRDEMREQSYNAEVIDEEYANDSAENWRVID